MTHALLGAVTAQLKHQSAVAGGLGAGSGELAAGVIADRLFAGKTLEQLSASEKQQVSALSQLAAGLAGGLVTGDAGVYPRSAIYLRSVSVGPNTLLHNGLRQRH